MASEPTTTTGIPATVTAAATTLSTPAPPATSTAQRPLANSHPPAKPPHPPSSQFPLPNQHQKLTYALSGSFYARASQAQSSSVQQLPRPLQQPHPYHLPNHSQSIIGSIASSAARGYASRPAPTRAQDCSVALANLAAGYPPRSQIGYAHLPHPLHGMKHPNLTSAPLRGIPVSLPPKVASSLSPVSDSNGYNKNTRDRSRDDTFAVIRDRKVRISDGASLYSLCRSWLRNGHQEDNQLQYGDGSRSLPRPLSIHMEEARMENKKEGEENKEEQVDEGSVDHLSAQDLLKKHVKRAKKVRARLREERLKRIARYKMRLALLLPQQEHLRNDAGAGNLPPIV